MQVKVYVRAEVKVKVKVETNATVGGGTPISTEHRPPEQEVLCLAKNKARENAFIAFFLAA